MENQCTIGTVLTPWELLADWQPGALMQELIYCQNNVTEPVSGCMKKKHPVLATPSAVLSELLWQSYIER